MPKPHHEVLVFKKTVWLSTHFDLDRGTQRWRVYRRPVQRGLRSRCLRPWWSGLTPKPKIPQDVRNEALPTPLLRAYAFTEWSWDTPQLPNGTDLWVEDTDAPNRFEIWYSELNWQDCLSVGEQGWEYKGIAYWEP